MCTTASSVHGTTRGWCGSTGTVQYSAVQSSTVQYSTCVRAQDGRGRGQLPGGLHHHRGVCLDVLFYDCIVVNLHVSDMLHDTHNNKLIKGLFMFYAIFTSM